jgi:hypothetical protein
MTSRDPKTSTQGSASRRKTPDPSAPLAETEETPETTGRVLDAPEPAAHGYIQMEYPSDEMLAKIHEQ